MAGQCVHGEAKAEVLDGGTCKAGLVRVTNLSKTNKLPCWYKIGTQTPVPIEELESGQSSGPISVSHLLKPFTMKVGVGESCAAYEVDIDGSVTKIKAQCAGQKPVVQPTKKKPAQRKKVAKA